MIIIIWGSIYPIRGNLQIARSPAVIRCVAILVQGAEDHILHPVTIPVEAVTGSVNYTMVAALDGSTGADEIPTCGAGKKDFPDCRKGIRKVLVARRLS